MPPAEREALADRLRPIFRERVRELRVDADLSSALTEFYVPLAAWIAEARADRGAPVVIGVNGAPGSGKTTLCPLVIDVLERGLGLRATSFSIDDIYKTRTQRREMARTVHPLFITRSVPGTHDPQLGIDTLRRLRSAGEGDEVPIPVFDKVQSDRLPESHWRVWRGPLDVVLFEGWCVGARPMPEAELAAPINRLEAERDPDGTWRRHVNACLAGGYAELFAELDRLVMLKVPGYRYVFKWRWEQERKMAEAARASAVPGQRAGNRLMAPDELRWFLSHNERLMRWMLRELPERADLVADLNAGHQIERVHVNRPPESAARCPVNDRP